VWKFSEAVQAGTMSVQEFMKAESCMSRSAGTCMTMGTASTMASLAEALGVALPENAAIPAVDSRRYALAQVAGRHIVDLVKRDVRLSHILTREAFENAIRVCGAIGGSTNAVVHLLALAGRLGLDLTMDDWDRLGRDIPTIVNLMPSGQYLMEDFYYAGGLPVVQRRLLEAGKLHGHCMTVNGKTQADNVAQAECYNDEVIRPLDQALVEQGGLAILRGNLAPQGAVIKPSAATAALMQHKGRAVVFENIEHYKQRI
jgi:dihydroxy-acid dehydratase